MNECRIVEDLLPLYEENLLQSETQKWVEQHLAICVQCSKLTNIEFETLPTLPKPKKSAEQMMYQAQVKLTIYQILFVLLSFVFAMNTSLLNESFAFILSYFILGAVTYYFYQNLVLTVLLASIPIFIWAIFDSIQSFGSLHAWYSGQIGYYSSPYSMFTQLALGGLMMALIHTLFAVLGALTVYLIKKTTINQK
ncbi:hypothetical protein CSE16_01540 [Solibacillus sp. R5-41]|uniref:zf-HC2 domain-containing protein n=1 Tax=Solibacillus sp. R5-41 TaxID=2048654 RepID=UPI000C12954F|nr:zf-HC2 domain-containing protein [Solibacillus sp. R5-41]ATP38801.1 hypothetical protein CSE16_01540 [Solibacillus sp. R5-41]